MFSNCTLLQKTTAPARPLNANLDRCTGYEDEYQRDDRSNLYKAREESERCTRTGQYHDGRTGPWPVPHVGHEVYDRR